MGPGTQTARTSRARPTRVAFALAAAALLNACARPGTAPGATRAATQRPPARATAQVVGGTRTVLSPLGLNIHSDAAASASVVGVAAQGTVLMVVGYRADNGGWYKVEGQSVTGWIVSDPTLSAAGQLTSYQSARGFSVLYPANWTFAEEPNDSLFRPEQGSQESIVVRTGPSTASFGQRGLPGYTSTYEDDSTVVCGYTGALVEYARASGATTTPTPNGSSAVPLSMYAEIRLRFDAAHAMQIAFNYDSQSQFTVFEDFYNSITFDYPQCEAPASPGPT